ncbi:MAG: hypothetical protein RL701_7167 [Pseudomonadota bacterium]
MCALPNFPAWRSVLASQLCAASVCMSACDCASVPASAGMSDLPDSEPVEFALVATNVESQGACKRGESGVLRGNAVAWDPADEIGAPDLRGITRITGTLDLFASERVLEDLACLRTVGALNVSRLGDSASTRSLHGLEQLQSVTGPLFIDDTEAAPGANFAGLSGLESVGADLEIRGPGRYLRGVEGFENLRTITGRLVIGGYELAAFTGLERLRSVGRDVVIELASSLQNFKALKSLTTLAGSLELRGSGPGSTLRDFNGLEHLTQLGGLSVSGLDSLQNLRGLPSLTHLTGSIQLSDLPALRSIDALSELRSTGGAIIIRRTPKLTRLTALSQLEETAGLSLIEADAVTSLSAFARLTRISGDLTLVGNDALRTLDGLQGVRALRALYVDSSALTALDGLENMSTLQNLVLTNNPRLTRIDALNQLTTVPGEIKITSDPMLTSLAGLTHVTQVGSLVLQDSLARNTLTALAPTNALDLATMATF